MYCFIGWLDNAGSFDKLIPLLSRGKGILYTDWLVHMYIHDRITDLYVVAIDWPGHGLSSPRPAGELYHHINMVVDMKYVIEGM